MQLLLRTKKFSLIGVSIAGAAMHGVGQIIAAMLLLSTFSVIFYLPFLLFSAIFTGASMAVPPILYFFHAIVGFPHPKALQHLLKSDLYLPLNQVLHCEPRQVFERISEQRPAS